MLMADQAGDVPVLAPDGMPLTWLPVRLIAAAESRTQDGPSAR
jgi:hypothetical protein